MNQRYILATDYASNPHTFVVDETTGKRVDIRTLARALEYLAYIATIRIPEDVPSRDDFIKGSFYGIQHEANRITDGEE